MRRVNADQAPVPGAVPERPPGADALIGSQRLAINLLDKLAFALRIPPPGDALLERSGGRPRAREPHRSATVPRVTLSGSSPSTDVAPTHPNIEANPRVRVKGSLSRTGWRSGMAHILDDDDPVERMRILSDSNRWRRLCLQASERSRPAR